MKSRFILFILGFILSGSINAQDIMYSSCKVKKVEDYNNLYRYQSFFLGGQPNLQMLHWLKDQGVGTIINLRSEEENSDYANYAFDEKSNAEEMGFEYFSIPIDGIGDFTPENLEAMADLLETRDDVLIHCASAGRVTNFFMAYLIKYQAYSVDEAIIVGKSLKFSFPLENLLDKEIRFEIPE